MATNRFRDKFSPGKIGTGRLHIAGKLGTGKPGERFKRRGLAGALRKFKTEGRFTYGKNLSNNDLRITQGILGKRLKKLLPHSKGLSRKARLSAKIETRKEWKAGRISKADKDDIDNMIDALGVNVDRQVAKSKPSPDSQRQPTQRAVRFATDDMARTAPDEPAAKTRLGKLPIDPLTAKKNRKKASEQPLQPVTKQEKTEEDIIAKRENLDSEDDNKVVELDIG